MKKYLIILAVIVITLLFFACKKDQGPSERFKLLTGHAWVSDSLLVDGVDASGPGGLLEKFAGDAVFNVDGTGYFGQYEGKWYFSNGEKDITINSDDLAFPLTCRIVELTSTSFKITTNFPTGIEGIYMVIRITFKPK